MKKTLALLVSAAAACTAHAQSSVTIYGLMDLSVGVSDTGEGTTLPSGVVRTANGFRNYRMDSGLMFGSRLGFRGVEDLGGGLRANFLLEMGINANTGGLNQGGLAWGRQIFVGLGGSNWSVTAGRQYTPINNSIAASEPLSGGSWGNITAEALGAYESIGAGAGSGGHQMTGRANNSVLFTASGGGVTGNLLVAAGDSNGRGTARLINPGVTYVAGPLRLDASYVRMRQNAEQIIATATPEWLDQWLVGGSYDFKVAKLFAGAFRFNGPKNKASLSATATLGATGAGAQAFGWDSNKLYWIGAGIPLGGGTAKMQVGRQTFEYASGGDGTATILGLAYDYPLSKRTLLYTSYGRVSNNERARAPLYGAIPQVGPNGFGSDPSAFSVGILHRF
ncbi:MAG TPA: porin [Burkholderiaceae bacterium]|nr:porin [Burkholderiaceae bacterium]